jgi:hypothetical protein
MNTAGCSRMRLGMRLWRKGRAARGGRSLRSCRGVRILVSSHRTCADGFITPRRQLPDLGERQRQRPFGYAFDMITLMAGRLGGPDLKIPTFVLYCRPR